MIISSTKKVLSALLLTGMGLAAIAAPPPEKVQSVKLLDSYKTFFPSLRENVEKGSRVEKPLFKNPHTKLSPESNIYGFLYFFQSNTLQQGMYRINPSQTPTFLWADYYTHNWTMPMNNGWIRDGKLCGTNSMIFMGGMLSYAQVEMDMETGEVLKFTPLTVDVENVNNVYVTCTYRDIDNRVYGYGYINDGSKYGFKSADADNIDTSAPVCEAVFENVCTALCYNVQEDTFYGVTTQGDFVSITPTGEQTRIMTLDIGDLSSTVTGIVYSPKDEAYIYNAYFKDGNSAIYSIDAEAKSCTKLYDCTSGEEFVFMVTTDDNVKESAPERPEFERAEFEGASLNGTLHYNLPRETVGHQAIASTLDWKLYMDGKQIKTGTAQAGGELIIDMADVPNGMRHFSLVTGSDGNWSLPTGTSLWIGSDYPNAPRNVTLTNDKLTWDKSEGTVYGGYVDDTAIRYKVTLNGNEVTETASTECVIELPQGCPYTSYQAEVIAVADNKSSEPGVSNYINYGDAIKIPAEGSLHYRPEEYEFPLFKAIDIDGKTDSEGNTRNWHFSTTMGFPSFASGADGEDMLIFPPINFEHSDKAYRFEMEAGLISDIDDTGTIEVLIGKEPNAESMTRTIIPATRLYHMLGQIMVEFFSVPEPGTYYIAVLTHTNKVAFHISDIDIALTDRPADVPMVVTDLKATAGANGILEATVTFTLPTKTVGGKDLDPDKELTAKVITREYKPNKPYEGKDLYFKEVTGKPGETLTTTVTTVQNYNTIAVSCSYDNRTGAEATTDLYTGLVKPYIVQNLKAEVSEDNMSVRLSWTPPLEGEEEGVIGDSFFYTVWFYNDGWQRLQEVGWDINEAVVSVEDGAPLNAYSLGIMALNNAGQSDHIASVSAIIGTPYTLPMYETMQNGEEMYWPIMIHRPDKSYDGTYWMVDDPANVAALFANDSGIANIGYIGMEGVTSAKSRLSLPKFSTEGRSDIKITLNYWGGPYAAPFSLLSNVHGSEEFTPIGEFPEGNGWISNTLNLPEELNNLKWVELYLDTEYKDANTFGIFSGYSITGISGVEGVAHDGSNSIFTGPGMIYIAGMSGQPLVISDLQGLVIVNVAKLGDLDAYTVVPGTYIVRAGEKSVKVIVK